MKQQRMIIEIAYYNLMELLPTHLHSNQNIFIRGMYYQNSNSNKTSCEVIQSFRI